MPAEIYGETPLLLTPTMPPYATVGAGRIPKIPTVTKVGVAPIVEADDVTLVPGRHGPNWFPPTCPGVGPGNSPCPTISRGCPASTQANMPAASGCPRSNSTGIVGSMTGESWRL